MRKREEKCVLCITCYERSETLVVRAALFKEKEREKEGRKKEGEKKRVVATKNNTR